MIKLFMKERDDGTTTFTCPKDMHLECIVRLSKTIGSTNSYTTNFGNIVLVVPTGGRK